MASPFSVQRDPVARRHRDGKAAVGKERCLLDWLAVTRCHPLRGSDRGRRRAWRPRRSAPRPASHLAVLAATASERASNASTARSRRRMALDVEGLVHRVLDVPAQPAGVVKVQWRAEAQEDEEQLGNEWEPLGRAAGWRVQLVLFLSRESRLDRHGAFAVAVLVPFVQPRHFSLELVGRFALGRLPRHPAAHHRQEARPEAAVLSRTAACRLQPALSERRHIRAGGVREWMGGAMRHDDL
mmetsp:Transcript_30425/g.78919  ORF Transcript_30425/g.78919 Transcript_30425/m.78919 type:complete len:241 (-) Transcript_30425:334-1056(-)